MMDRFLVLSALSLLLTAADAQRQPVELGAIRFERDFAAAKQRCVSGGGPLLVLFQEVPG